MAVGVGTLATRLLRPVHPLLGYTTENVAAMPMRAAVALPVACAILLLEGTRDLTHDPVLWLAWVLAVLGGWVLSLLLSFVIGALAFFLESSLKVIDVWLAGYFVFSGYLVPVDLFPPALRAVSDFLPFRYQLGFCVELMTGAHDRTGALVMLGRQWAYVVLAALVLRVVWRRGLTRFAAFGG
jgi:ABC-2 type transport system permease protein